MTNTMHVIMYPEGIIVGKVASGKRNKTSRVRHVGFDLDGNRLGTFDTYNEAHAAVIEAARATTR